MQINKILKPLLNTIFTLAAFAYLYEIIDWQALKDEIGTIDYRFAFVAILLQVPVLAISTFRWLNVSEVFDIHLKFKSAFYVSSSSTFYNLFLPASVGYDLAKAKHMSEQQAPAKMVIKILIADKVYGLGTLLLIALPSLPLIYPLLGSRNAQNIFILITIFMVVGLGILLTQSKMTLLASKLISTLKNVVLPEASLKQMFIIIIQSACIHIIVIVQVVLLALGTSILLPITSWFAAVAPAILLTRLPISVNGIGVREAAFVFLLQPFDITSEKAVIIGLSFFTISIITSLIGGSLIFLKQFKRITAD
jgi:uncharacterized membrane protein YbhN (UPF0104 family)